MAALAVAPGRPASADQDSRYRVLVVNVPDVNHPTSGPAGVAAVREFAAAAANHAVPRGVAPARVWGEWYSWNTSPRRRAGFTVLATLDETSYDVGRLAMGDHPIARVAEPYGRTRVAGFGHDPSVYRDPDVRQLLRNAIRWVLARPGVAE